MGCIESPRYGSPEGGGTSLKSYLLEVEVVLFNVINRFVGDTVFSVIARVVGLVA